MTLEEIRSNVKWWESKRWIFNIVIGFIGCFTIYDSYSRGEYSWVNKDITGIVFWGICANIFYSTGILLELLDWYYFKNRIGFKKMRLLFFVIGLVFSSLFTLWCGWNYFSKPYLW